MENCRRVIHASADFELGRNVIIHPNAIQAGVEAIRKGRHVIADVQMIESGTGKNVLKNMAGTFTAIFQIQDVMVEAKSLNTTRAIISMQKAVKENEGGIYAIGNAPTAFI